MSRHPTRVLVTGAGGPSGVSFMEAAYGHELELFAADCDAYAAGLYLVPRANRILLPRGDDPRFIARLVDECATRQIDVLVPTVDVELEKVARARASFEVGGTAVLVADVETLNCCLDKWELVRVCAEVCPTPRSALLDSSFDADSWGYPFFVKPRRGAGGDQGLLVRNAEDLATRPRDGSVLVQEYLPGEEFSVDVLSDLSRNVLAIVPRLRLRINSGIAVCGRTLFDETLTSQARAVALRIGLTYVANVQFRRDGTGVAKLLDVNVRFPGTIPLTIAAGVNMPCLALDLIANRPMPANVGVFREIGMVRTWREHLVPPAEFEELVRRAQAMAE
jgi:carbamoyl-phosphate synthase large subunit